MGEIKKKNLYQACLRIPMDSSNPLSNAGEEGLSPCSGARGFRDLLVLPQIE